MSDRDWSDGWIEGFTAAVQLMAESSDKREYLRYCESRDEYLRRVGWIAQQEVGDE
jgi:hypothetical protein